VWRDLRLTFRQLRRSLGFAVVATTSLAIAIGANCSIVAVADALLLRPLPISNSNELFIAAMAAEYGDDFSYPMIRQAADLLGGRGEICGQSTLRQVQIEPGSEGAGLALPDSANLRLVTGQCFSVFRQRPAVGRLLAPADDRVRDGHPVVVISDRFWGEVFHRSPTTVGRVIHVNGLPMTIVGVTRPEFFGTTVGATPPDLWAPALMQSALRYSGNGTSLGGDWDRPYVDQKELYWLTVLLRTQEPDWAASTLQLALERELPDATSARTSDGRVPRITVTPGARGFSPFRERVRSQLQAMLGIPLVLLILASTNIAGILLARGMARQRDLAVRYALGASRFAIARQALLESLVIALAGGTLGLLLAFKGSAVFLTLMNRGTPITGFDVSPDWRVALLTLAAASGVGLLAAAATVWRSTRVGTSMLHAARATRGDHSVRRTGAGAVLTASQIAITIVLLVAAALCVRSLRALTTIDLGMEPDEVVVARIDPLSAGYLASDMPALSDRLMQAIRAVPGVTQVSLSVNGPLGGGTNEGTLVPLGYTPAPGERVRGIRERVVGDYVETLGMHVVAGRNFTGADAAPGRRVSLINETMARRYFGADPLGRRWGYNANLAEGYEIVGVVKDARYRTDLKVADDNMVYVLASSEAAGVLLRSVEVRVSSGMSAALPAIRAAIRSVDPRLPVRSIEPLDARVAAGAAAERLLASVSTVFAGVAVLLACIGLYGLTSYGVSRRTGEIGVRMAIGAAPGQVRALILREGLVLVAAGLAVGLPIAFAAARAFRSQLYGITPADLPAFAGATLVLVVVMIAAVSMPAHRASRLQPTAALRSE
jgi:predicted permease